VEGLKRVIQKFYSPKHITISMRLDTPTYIAAEELKSALNLNTSQLFRLSVWLLSLLFDKSTTVRQLLSAEALEKVPKERTCPLSRPLAPWASYLRARPKTTTGSTPAGSSNLLTYFFYINLLADQFLTVADVPTDCAVVSKCKKVSK